MVLTLQHVSNILREGASLDFGVFVCSNCSGAHRALGPTITRVKSTKLDLWDRKWFANMVLGNEEINRYWEQNSVEAMIKYILLGIRKPKVGSELYEYNRFVSDKYTKKKYVVNKNDIDPLTAYKNGGFQPKIQKLEETKPKKHNEEDEYEKKIQKRMEKKGISETIPASVPTTKKETKKDFNLLDDEEPVIIQNQAGKNEGCKSASEEPSNRTLNDDDFTPFVSGNENLSTERNSEISFEELLKQPKLETAQSQQQGWNQNQPQGFQQGYQHQYHHPQYAQNHPGFVQYNAHTHNAYVGYAQHYHLPHLQQQKSQPAQQTQSPQHPPPYQNFTLN